MFQLKPYMLALAAAFALSACGGHESSNANTATPATSTAAPAPEAPQTPAAASSANAETIMVGSEISYVPFEFADPQGQPTGFEVELLTEIAKAEGFNVQFVNAPRTTVEETLNSGKFRIWASSLSISAERKEKMDMSEPFLDYERAVLVLDKPENSKIVDAASLKDLTIAANKGSKNNLDKIAELGAKAAPANSFYLSLSVVYAGKADAVMGDTRIFEYYQLQNKDIATRIIPLGESKKQLGFAVKKGDTELLAKINSGLAKVKADGTLDKLIGKYFGSSKAS